ncbi:MAG: hypothetical protein OEZ39_18295 [Gammaproteobacteria bacterium]|nr:hypothetical protein [Gammaproteobacteria bacterium]MDH5653818.1 hypothetical protein [Gammaproteobacteria bacterium]
MNFMVQATRLITFYFFGMMFWLITFAVLRNTCLLNTSYLIDGMLTEKVNDYFVRHRLTGKPAFHADGYGCENVYLYTAQFSPTGDWSDVKNVALSDLVDVTAWREVKVDPPAINYTDGRYSYKLFHISDGVLMKVSPL